MPGLLPDRLSNGSWRLAEESEGEMTDFEFSPEELNDTSEFPGYVYRAFQSAWNSEREAERGYPPSNFYLAHFKTRIDPDLITHSDVNLIIKVGKADDVDIRQGQIKGQFRIIAHVETPSQYHATTLESAIKKAMYRSVPDEIVKDYDIDTPTDCMMHGTSEYDLLATLLNIHFGADIFPLHADEGGPVDCFTSDER